MYRRLFFVVSQKRNTILFAQDSGLLFPATLANHRSAISRGRRSLGSSLAVCSEIKDDPEPPKQEQKEKDGERQKAGKDHLLELLASMKVKVTSKKVWDPKLTSSDPVSVLSETEGEPSVSQEAVAKLPPQSEESLSPGLVAAAEAAASSMPNPTKAKSELLKQLRKHEAVPEDQRKREGNNLGSIIAQMKVAKHNKFRTNDRAANQIRFDDDGRKYTFDKGGTKLERDGGSKGLLRKNRLKIFTPVSEKMEPETDVAIPRLSIWDVELANEIASAMNARPRNGFEEMIQWTEEGKLWEYPIDNEAGLEEEASVPFHEHVFLDKHLQEGFPSRGPVRHFMELVVVGLSKNPNLTVREKVEHIAWFRRYFQEKEDVLREAEAYLN